LLFTIGCLLLIGGWLAESAKPIGYGAAFLTAAAILSIAVLVLRRRGWWY
jgi:hypothetical protein